MATLTALLHDDSRREALIRDLAQMVESHVAGRSGLRGLTLRAGLAAVRRKLPDAIPRSVTRLLPDLLEALEPLQRASRAATGKDFAKFLTRDPAQVAETLLAIADARVGRSTNEKLKTFYASFRGTAEKEAEALVPGLAAVLGRHLA